MRALTPAPLCGLDRTVEHDPGCESGVDMWGALLRPVADVVYLLTEAGAAVGIAATGLLGLVLLGPGERGHLLLVSAT